MPSLGHLINAPIAGTRNSTYPALWYGLITAASPTSVQVSVPALADEPLPAVNTLPNRLSPGQRVIIGLMEGKIDNLLVLALMDPTVPAHTHTAEDITAPRWVAATLAAPWTVPTTGTGYRGLRHRADGDRAWFHGTITGGPGTITTTDYRPTYASALTAHTPEGTTKAIAFNTDGTLTTTTAGPLTINSVAPLT